VFILTLYSVPTSNTTNWLYSIAQYSLLKEMHKGLSKSPANNTEYLLKIHYAV